MQTRYNLPIEILYTVAPVIMVLVLFFFTVQTQNDVLATASDTGGEPDHVIEVVGQQWSWTFNYMNEESLGSDDSTDDVYVVGTTAEPPTLVLPVGETVRVNLNSPDVIHSFWVPAFLMKMDVIPGRHNGFEFTPTREGTYAGRCAELCGVYHSRMLFNLDVVSPTEYEEYLQTLADKGDVGTVLGGVDADTQAGLDEAQNEQVQQDDTAEKEMLSDCHTRRAAHHRAEAARTAGRPGAHHDRPQADRRSSTSRRRSSGSWSAASWRC